MKIFGIGLTRTGTNSLTKALKILGYSCIHLPMNYQDIENHDASTDTPVAARFPILDLLYPCSKFILTIRDKNDWIQSASILKRSKQDPLWLLEGRAILYKSLVFDEKKFLEAYDNHYNFVLNYFKTRMNCLLILDLKDQNKWEKLCNFLEKPIPNIKYPHLNKRVE